MKFGKYLQKRQLDIPEYAASFVNYKALKKLIKQLSTTPVLRAQNEAPELSVDPQASLQANKATFFFRLERELEKVNAFYLQKEAELKLRLKTLLDKKKVMQSRHETTSKIFSKFITLEEGFQQFGNDLNKLQQFVEINATAFSKILKKWDKTSKSRTREIYLSRAIEVQPCFNRDVISELSDQATTSLLELGAWAEGEKLNYEGRPTDHIISTQSIGTDQDEADYHLLEAVTSGNIPSLKDWITRLKDAANARDRLTRTFLAAISDAPQQSLQLLLDTNLVDICSEDEINERNALHEAAISGREFVLALALSQNVDPSRVDVYGRIPLHYACIHGRVNMLQALISAAPSTIDVLDHDNFTPLIQAIKHHKLDCVHDLLTSDARIDPSSESDHVPLNLACQYGSTTIVELLLQKGAKILADAEGLFPQHLVARTGTSPELLLLLRDYGADLDEIDKSNQWTPLFHAASEGNVSSLQILLDAGAKTDILDDKRLSAMYYAAWEGHLKCMNLLGSAGGTLGLSGSTLNSHPTLQIPASSAPKAMATDPDAIPDLSLPPPIIPLRRYGHNFLDTKTFVQINFDSVENSPIHFYHDSKYPAARLTISSKHSDLIPRNVMIPIQEDSRIISFQIDSLETFTVDFDVFPTFGAKVIAKTVALSNIFRAEKYSSGHCHLPLFDHRLRAIGQLSFSFQVIKPFHGIPLEITHFATYWKATSHLDSHPSALITGSSLSGEYVRLFVQMTSDGVAVLYPYWAISHGGLQLPVSRLTYEQFISIGSQQGKGDEALAALPNMDSDRIPEMHQILATSFASLKNALSYIPMSVHIEIHALYPTAIQERENRLEPIVNLNTFADAILADVFDHTRGIRETTQDFLRSIVFSSFNAGICTALNWKQPNYPVFLCDDLGREEQDSSLHSTVLSSGRNSISVKEAVRIAQCNNLMGLICCSKLLDMVPALVESVKVAGLVLVIDTSGEANADPFMRVREGVDGILRGNGVLRFNETIDM